MTIPLKNAVFCVSCETVTVRQPDSRCAHCGSDAVMDLARVLNREEEEISHD